MRCAVGVKVAGGRGDGATMVDGVEENGKLKVI